MTDASDLRHGQRVTVHVRGKEKDAIIRKVPPFTDHVCGDEIKRTDSAMVQYPNSSLDGGGMFGDIQERIPLEDIDVDG